MFTDGWHHDSSSKSIELVDRGPDGAGQVFVHSSQYVSPDGNVHPPIVEMQDESRTLALLTTGEARDAAKAGRRWRTRCSWPCRRRSSRGRSAA